MRLYTGCTTEPEQTFDSCLGWTDNSRYIGRDLCFVRARVVWCVYKKRPLYWDLLRLYITWHIEPEQTLTHLAVEYSSFDTFEVSFFALTRGHDISSAQVEG